MSKPFWHDLPEIDEPVTDYLGDLAAKNDALAVRRRILNGDALVATYREAGYPYGNRGAGLLQWIREHQHDGPFLDDPDDVVETDPTAADAWLDSFRADEARDYNPTEA